MTSLTNELKRRMALAGLKEVDALLDQAIERMNVLLDLMGEKDEVYSFGLITSQLVVGSVLVAGEISELETPKSLDSSSNP